MPVQSDYQSASTRTDVLTICQVMLIDDMSDVVCSTSKKSVCFLLGNTVAVVGKVARRKQWGMQA